MKDIIVLLRAVDKDIKHSDIYVGSEIKVDR